MQSGRGKVAGATVVWMALVVTAVAVAAVLLGGSAAWLAEQRMPGSTITSWGDGLWWALTTLTTVGYGDHVPVTVAGRLVAAAVMVAGVAVLGGVAAGIALVVARSVAATEEHALEVEAKSIEHRVDARFDDLDERLARIEEQLQRVASRTCGSAARLDVCRAGSHPRVRAHHGRDDQLPPRRSVVAGRPASPRTRSRTFQRNTAHCTTAHPLTATATAPSIGPTGLIRWK